MKVGLVLERFDPTAGGLERWTFGFAQFLAAQGHDPHVLAFDAVPDPPAPVHRLQPARTTLARARSAAAGVDALGADVVLDTGTGTGGDVFMPCTGSRRWSQQRLVATHKTLMRLRAALSPRSRALDLALAVLERQQVRRARHIVAVSMLVRDLLLRQHKIEPSRISVVPNGVDTARFAPERLAPLRERMRAELGVGDGVLFLGSAHNMWLKGMDTAIRALDLLVFEEADVHLAIAGSTPDETWIRMAAESGSRIRFLGPVDDIAPLFAAADALVHPTRWDACSLSTIEAGAAGLPAITTVRNGASELIQDGETGFVLTDPDDVGALAERMRRLLDPALRQRMGAAAREASRGHDVQANYAAVLAILAANSRGRSAGAASS